jgi:hypothetical protein
VRRKARGGAGLNRSLTIPFRRRPIRRKLPGVNDVLGRLAGMIPPHRGSASSRHRPLCRPAIPGPTGGGSAPDDPTIPRFLIEATPPPPAVRASEAARGFSAGNGFISGLIVDRLA